MRLFIPDDTDEPEDAELLFKAAEDGGIRQVRQANA